jgi:hypothetical protein
MISEKTLNTSKGVHVSQLGMRLHIQMAGRSSQTAVGA